MTLGVASTVDTSMTHIIEEDLSVERFFRSSIFRKIFQQNFFLIVIILVYFIFYDSIRIIIILVYLSFTIQFEFNLEIFFFFGFDENSCSFVCCAWIGTCVI